jgi:Motility quorum-sensing regulator, toxin of MqsA
MCLGGKACVFRLDKRVAWCYHSFVPDASYSLEEIKLLIANGNYWIKRSALDGALALGFDNQDICECICDYLDGTHFYKTMSSEKKPDLMQDVYRITYEQQPIYLKLQISNKQAVVISFKHDESA